MQVLNFQAEKEHLLEMNNTLKAEVNVSKKTKIRMVFVSFVDDYSLIRLKTLCSPFSGVVWVILRQ